MAALPVPWNIFPMASNPEKKAEAEKRAQEICRRLLALRDEREPNLSNNDWTKRAGVSTSFFTNMQGKRKPASEPSIGNLRAVLEAIGSSLPEFFAGEAEGRLVHPPTQPALEQALADAWDELPRQQVARVAYLASTVRKLLELPERRAATADSPDDGGQGGREEASPIQSATKRASRQ